MGGGVSEDSRTIGRRRRRGQVKNRLTMLIIYDSLSVRMEIIIPGRRIRVLKIEDKRADQAKGEKAKV